MNSYTTIESVFSLASSHSSANASVSFPSSHGVPGMLPTLMWCASNVAAMSNSSPSPPIGLVACRAPRVDEEVGEELDLEVLEAGVLEDLAHLVQAAGLELVLDVGMPQAKALEADLGCLGAAIAPVERAPLTAYVHIRGTANRPVKGQQLDLAHRHSSSLRRTATDASAAPGDSPANPCRRSCRSARCRAS